MKLDVTIFNEAGLGSLTDKQKTRILAFLEQTLVTRFGIYVVSRALPEQLEEYDNLTSANDDEAIFDWLEKSFPDYQKIVDKEVESLKRELKTMAPNVLKADRTGKAR